MLHSYTEIKTYGPNKETIVTIKYGNISFIIEKKDIDIKRRTELCQNKIPNQ